MIKCQNCGKDTEERTVKVNGMNTIIRFVENVNQRLREKLMSMRKNTNVKKDRKQTDVPLTAKVESESSEVTMPEEHRKSIEQLLEEVIRNIRTANELQQEINTYTLESLSLQRDNAQAIQDGLDEIKVMLAQISEDLVTSATGFTISQLDSGGNVMATITGVPAGGQGTFQETPTPAGGALQAGAIPAWTADDAAVVLTPSSDGTTVVAAVPATDTAASFNLTVTGVSSNGSTISQVTNVPILPGVAVPATGFSVSQIA